MRTSPGMPVSTAVIVVKPPLAGPSSSRMACSPISIPAMAKMPPQNASISQYLKASFSAAIVTANRKMSPVASIASPTPAKAAFVCTGAGPHAVSIFSTCFASAFAAIAGLYPSVLEIVGVVAGDLGDVAGSALADLAGTADLSCFTGGACAGVDFSAGVAAGSGAGLGGG